jgi:DNA-binding IclR family transcriptional regulator
VTSSDDRDRLLSLLRRCLLTRREQRIVLVILSAAAPLTAGEVARRTRLHYSHCKAVVRALVAWSLLERTPEGLRFQPDPARWGPPTVPPLAHEDGLPPRARLGVE